MWILASTCAVSGCKNFIEHFGTLTARENSAWDLRSGCESSWQHTHTQHGMVNDLWKEHRADGTDSMSCQGMSILINTFEVFKHPFDIFQPASWCIPHHPAISTAWKPRLQSCDISLRVVAPALMLGCLMVPWENYDRWDFPKNLQNERGRGRGRRPWDLEANSISYMKGFIAGTTWSWSLRFSQEDWQIQNTLVPVTLNKSGMRVRLLPCLIWCHCAMSSRWIEGSDHVRSLSARQLQSTQVRCARIWRVSCIRVKLHRLIVNVQRTHLIVTAQSLYVTILPCSR